ncbi:lipid II:glycine glycyltransferase FemX [Patescibacteria group bacterium]
MNLISLDQSHKDLLNNYVRNNPHGSLYQTFEWGEFQKEAGFKVWRLGVLGEQKLCSAATVLKYDMPGNKWYLYSPRLIMSNDQLEMPNAKMFAKIADIARQEGCIFFRFDPLVIKKDWQSFGEVPALKEIQPRDTVMVDLAKTEEEILKNMKSKWRYNVRLSKRKGVKIRQSTDEKDLDKFYDIARVTAERDKFHIHEEKYYRALLKNLGPPGYVKLFVAEYEGKVLAVNIVSFYKDTATYMHGASSNEHRNLMAPHLLQWEAMRAAKNTGLIKYDLYGVAPADEPDHHWAGISRFKLGFGGERVRYVGAFDLVYSKFWYSMVKMMMKIKK